MAKKQKSKPRAVLTPEQQKRYEAALAKWKPTTDRLIKDAQDAQILSAKDFAVTINAT